MSWRPEIEAGQAKARSLGELLSLKNALRPQKPGGSGTIGTGETSNEPNNGSVGNTSSDGKAKDNNTGKK